MSTLRIWCLAIVTGTGLATAGAARGEWGTYQGNAAHDGYVRGRLDPAAHSVLWSSQLPIGQLTSVTVGGGGVYVSSDTQFAAEAFVVPTVFALDQQTGAIRWQKSTGNNFSVNPPAYAGGSVFVQTVQGVTGSYVWAFDAATGTQRFRTPMDAQWPRYLAPTVFDGTVYMDGGYGGGMYAVSAADGRVNWFGTVPQYDGWTPSVNGNYCYAFTGSGSTSPITGKFTILDRSTGATVSVTTTPDFRNYSYRMNQAPALGTMGDAFGTDGGRLMRFGTTPAGGLLSVTTDQYAGQPTVAAGTVYVADGQATVAALAEATGVRRWTWTAGDNGVLIGDLIATDNLLLASTNVNVYAIDEQTGQTVWSLPIPGTLALSDHTLFISSATNGTVTAVTVPEPACLVPLAAAALLRRRRPDRQ